MGARLRLPLPRAPQPARPSTPPQGPTPTRRRVRRGRRALPSALRSLPRGRRREEAVPPRLPVPQHQLLQGDQERLSLHLTSRLPAETPEEATCERLQVAPSADGEKETRVV